VRPAHATHLFQEVCTTLDVSRYGLLFTAGRKGYAKGQRLEVVFPYESAAVRPHHGQIAEVMRVDELSDGTMQVAIEFLSAREQPKSDQHTSFAASEAAAAWMRSNEQPMILAIESDPEAAQQLRQALQGDAGYTVIVVDSSKHALDVMRKVVPAVVIAEAEARDISGQDLCLMIKRDTRLQAVPVILMTRAAQANYTAGHSLGAVTCMAKPFKVERLQHVVKLLAPPVHGSRAAPSA
jgi:CheY-like chemotaxis protein